MDPRRLDRGEVVAIIGGILLGASLLLAWYSLGNQFTTLGRCHGMAHRSVACSGWSSLELALRVIVILAAIAPLILAWIIARGHALSWPRGELTAVVALAALTLVIFVGLIDKPGFPNSEISVNYGWGLALVGGLMILIGSVWRSQESAGRRKPPGVL